LAIPGLNKYVYLLKTNNCAKVLVSKWLNTNYLATKKQIINNDINDLNHLIVIKPVQKTVMMIMIMMMAGCWPLQRNRESENSESQNSEAKNLT